MLFECPQCSKIIDMTLEELALSKKVVVCPQCLNEFLAQDVDIPASMLRTKVATKSAQKQLYCHSCGESLPVAGLKFCPYCGASQNLAASAAAIDNTTVSQESKPSTQAMGDSNLQTNEDKTVVEDDAYDMMEHLPFIRPLPRLPSKREVMGSPLTRTICYIIIFILIAIFLFVLYLSNFDDDGSIARSIGLNFE
ncbi:MAG: hypothetical protein IK100_06535 [Muribaculaceae bacterium]|nr:hypothetical protein [Muribaculaceae bacterium]MBR5118284.1 hypothetical protein [Muribaculaceae bacterium]